MTMIAEEKGNEMETVTVTVERKLAHPSVYSSDRIRVLALGKGSSFAAKLNYILRDYEALKNTRPVQESPKVPA